jgi:hypothetical protein
MSVDGETLSAITGMEEACATARARVEDLVAELDDLRRCIRSVITQRDEARAEVARFQDWYRNAFGGPSRRESPWDQLAAAKEKP